MHRARAGDEPGDLLFDEPTSALDPIATARIEELMDELRDQVTVIIVTHNMQQAARVSDYTAFMYLGELVEFDETEQLFTNPTQEGDRRLHHRPLWLSGKERDVNEPGEGHTIKAWDGALSGLRGRAHQMGTLVAQQVNNRGPGAARVGPRSG